MYDIMNRLTSAQVGTNTALTSNYSTDGNITVKSDAAGTGGLEYLSSRINAVTKIASPMFFPDNTQNISYSVFQRPTNINENTKSIDFSYSFDYERRMATFKTNNMVDETRIYGGNYEKQTIGSTIREIHYISNGERLIAIIVKEGTTTSNYYAHTDHLGSILAITDNSMNYVAQQNFDPWGRKRNHTTWTYTSVATVPTWLYRGFTGHESYNQFGLINMNARLYDPLTGRMLSPDIMVNMPYSSQGYNRYSYANNNPLKYTDPDGNEIISAILIGAAIGVAMNGVSNLIQEKNFFDGWLKSAIIGGVTGAISSGIGFLSTGSDKVVSELAKASIAERAIFQGLMHGWSGAVMTVLQGGNPGRGFVSGLISSLTASTVQNLGGGKIAIVIGGSLSGGVGAALVGGDFYQGAVFGLISSSLNHVAHEMRPIKTRLVFDGKTIKILVNGRTVFETKAYSGKPQEDGSFDYSIENQKRENIGPIPEGEYFVDLAKTQKWQDLDFIQKSAALFKMGRFPGGTIAWGSERVDLTPNGANIYGRAGGFTIHGGAVPGSAGCIDLTTNDRAFFNVLHTHAKSTIILKVKY